MIRVCFLIRQFDAGGAQRQLIELAKGLDKSRFSVDVLTFYANGQLADEIAGAPGVRLMSAGKRGRWDLVYFFFRLIRTVRQSNPDVLHSYLGVSNILAILLRPWLGSAKVVWGVRGSYRDLRRYDWLATLTYRLERTLARFADLVIFNSHSGREYHLGKGFSPQESVVIPNGINVRLFRPDLAARRRVRAEFGIAPGQELIGLVARLDPMKDHETFLHAAALVADRHPEARFLCIGNGRKGELERFQLLGRELGLADTVMWSAARPDVANVYNALDLLVSSSCWGEGFSNVIAEAMACEVPCVVTDVGDSRMVVGDTGIVVTPGDPDSLAEGIGTVLSEGDQCRRARGTAARTRVISEFSVERLVQRTEQQLLRLVADRSGDAA